jgi:hypothetical protein
MNLQENKRVHLQTHLKLHGYQFSSDLKPGRKKTVSIPAFGLCGYAALYCGDTDTLSSVAGDLSDLEGVDFSLFRSGPESVTVTGAAGVARIHRRATGLVSYRYEQLEGDPLQLDATVRELTHDGAYDPAGFASDEIWYEKTADHVYPDTLSNLFHSLYSPRVGHTADVLVSMRDGYYYGASLFGHMVKLAATHGNAMRASTNAFLMSTHQVVPAAVRASAAKQYLKGK